MIGVADGRRKSRDRGSRRLRGAANYLHLFNLCDDRQTRFSTRTMSGIYTRRGTRTRGFGPEWRLSGIRDLH